MYRCLRGITKQRRKRYGHYDSRGRLANKRRINKRPASVEQRQHLISRAAAATAFALLDRWTLDIAIGAKYTAVTRQRPEQHMAGPALIEPLARVGGHDLSLGGAALGTGDN